MLRSFIGFLVVLSFTGCAHKVHEAQVKKETKAMEFDGNCGMSLCLKKTKVKCDPEITLEYKGKNYCFSGADARDKFVENIDANIRSANDQWMIMGPR